MSLFRLVLLLALSLSACRSDSAPSAPDASAAAVPDALPPAPAPAEPGDRARLEAALAHFGQDGWYGVYMMGKKVGHGHVWSRRSNPGEPGLYALGFEMAMSVAGAGQANEIAVTELRFYGADFPHPLVETRFETKARGFSESRVATPVLGPDGAARAMRVVRSVGDKVEAAREVAPSADDLRAQLLVTPIDLREADAGRVGKALIWSWEREADESLTVTVKALETRMRAGVADRVAVLDVVYDQSGMRGTTQIAADGTLLEMSVGASMLLKLEERAVAESGVTGLDILGTGLASPRRLGRPMGIDRLVLEVSGPPGARLPAHEHQKVEALPERDGKARWRITLARMPGDLVSAADREVALAPDPTSDSEHPSIVAMAQKLAAESPDTGSTVNRIARYVFETLDKKLATHLPTASIILERKVGDCTEHTWLTVALLRAAKIPARPVYGVAYTGDGESLFAYHAWVEVALTVPASDPTQPAVERWVAIDPTWGEERADATHLQLGSSLSEVASTLGGLTIESAE